MVPKANEEVRMVSFFNCVATLMQGNLLELFHESLDEYADFMCLRLVLIDFFTYRKLLEFLPLKLIC